MPETMGSGGGFLDYDQDGWPDLFLVNSREWPGHETGAEPATSRLYRNRGDGTFEDVTASTGTGLTIHLRFRLADSLRWTSSYPFGAFGAAEPPAKPHVTDDDGVVTVLHVEEAGAFAVSDAETLLGDS